MCKENAHNISCPIEATNIFVKMVNENINEDQLIDAFSKIGSVKSCSISRAKNCAFIEFNSPEACQKALAQHRVPIGNFGHIVLAEERRFGNNNNNNNNQRYNNNNGGRSQNNQNYDRNRSNNNNSNNNNNNNRRGGAVQSRANNNNQGGKGRGAPNNSNNNTTNSQK